MNEHVRTSAPACVIDVRLALGSFGMLALTRLSRAWEMWAAASVRSVLRAPSPGESITPESLALNPEDDHEPRDIRESLALYERSATDPDVSSLPIFHVGDRADESSIPRSADRGLLSRYDQMRAGLDLLRAQDDTPMPPTLMECFCDTIALSGALAASNAFVLTRIEGEMPAICRALVGWGVPVTRVSADGASVCRDLRARLGALTVPVSFAAVHVLPRGMPSLGGALPGLDAEAVASRWQRSEVCWHPIGGTT